MRTGILRTFQNNSMALSCNCKIKIIDNIIVEKSFKGYPRLHVDSWTNVYKNFKIGQEITDTTMDYILKFNNVNNIISTFKDC